MGHWKTTNTGTGNTEYFNNSTLTQKPNPADKIIEETLNKTVEERGTVKKSKLRTLYNNLRVAASLMFGSLTMSPAFTAGTQSEPSQEKTIMIENPSKDDGKTFYMNGTNPGNGGLKETLADYIVINGHIERNPGQLPTPATVYAVDNTTGDTLDYTVANTAGDYNFYFAWTGTGNNISITKPEGKILGNPAKDRAIIQFSTPEKENYKLTRIDALGKQLFTQDVQLEKGTSNITLTGLAPSQINLVNFISKYGTTTFKIINQGTNREAPSVDVIKVSDETPELKSISSQDLKLMYRYPGCYDKDTLVENTSQTVNIDMQMIPYNVNFTLKPFLENGEPITNLDPNFSVTIKFPDSTQGTFPVVGNIIPVNTQIYPPENSTMSIKLSNDTTYVLSWSLGKIPRQPRNRANVYQNENPWNPNTSSYPPEHETTIPLDSLNGKLTYHYTVRKEAEGQPGQWYRMDSFLSRQLISSSGGNASGSFLKIPIIDTIDIAEFQSNYTTMTPNSPSNQARIDSVIARVKRQYYLLNGDTTLAPHRILPIPDKNSQLWTDIVNRGLESSIRICFDQGTPGNDRFLDNNYVYNNTLRIKYSYGKFPESATTGQLTEEIWQAFSGIQYSSGVAPYIYNSTTGQITQYGKALANFAAELNAGTPQ